MKSMNYWMFLVVISLMIGPLFFAYPRNRFLIVGHRGASGYEPENTLSSFQKALDMNVDRIELDVYVCASGELVVMHDEDVDRTTNGHGKVVDMDLGQLQSLVVGGKEKIPTLSQVIDLIHRRVPINIELKGPGTAKPVAALLKAYVNKGWKSTDFIVSSFDLSQIKEFKELCPEIQTGALFSRDTMLEDVCVAAKRSDADFIGLDAEIATKEFVAHAHKEKFPVFVWTVNDKEAADKMRAIKVNGIFSNYPDKVR